MPAHTTRDIIQDARDQLVGKVPLPIDQCHEITRALVYKFLSAVDTEAIKLSGEPTYFVDAHRESHWDRLMAPEQTANEIQRLYTAGLTMLGSRADIPPAFQTIYQDAFMPYNDPIVLRDFLGIINRFNTDDTESIGDAYETMLQYLGAQASAGQFRTPRHIIDFIVGIVNPEKHETILDPACGTAGFLASAYSHIAGANSGNFSFSDQVGLGRNLVGYDISPDMVKLATINLYLNHRQSPEVRVYDTLTSEERWNDHYDVVLANPPFMSPKGGIRPHQRFFTNSKRSEVLFVDYIMGHLNECGRAGVIVPEGVIFQSGNAYKQLRRLLVDTCLVAVVSLPGGVFQPYSGVKTSILIMDKELGKRADNIAFFKVQNDGYDLGAQRRPITANDLPKVQAEIAEYRRRLRARETLDDFAPTLGHIVAKSKIAADGDYNLSAERYHEVGSSDSEFPIVQLGDIAGLIRGITFRKSDQLETATPNSLPVATTKAAQETGIVDEHLYHIPRTLLKDDSKLLQDGDILISTANSLRLLGRTTHVKGLNRSISFGAFMSVIRANPDKVLHRYLVQCLRTDTARSFFSSNANTTTNISNLNLGTLATFQIPLPPLEVQREIVAEIEGYQRVIDGARAVVDNYRPHIAVDPEWPMVALGDACEIKRGKFAHRPRNESRFYGGNYPFIQTGDVTRANGGKISYTQTLNDEGLSISRLFQPPVVVITIAANIGDTAVLDFPCCFPDSVIGLMPNDGTDAWFLELIMRSKKQYLNQIAPQAAQKNINVGILKTLEVPLPSLEGV